MVERLTGPRSAVNNRRDDFSRRVKRQLQNTATFASVVIPAIEITACSAQSPPSRTPIMTTFRRLSKDQTPVSPESTKVDFVLFEP
jgi:hypothetical protein